MSGVMPVRMDWTWAESSGEVSLGTAMASLGSGEEVQTILVASGLRAPISIMAVRLRS